MAQPSTPDKWPSTDMFGDTIKVEIGIQEKSFTLHRGVVGYYSGYFEAAMKHTFKEGQEGVIKLPTENVVVFEHFVRWLYTRKLPESLVMGEAFPWLCDLWLFADRRQCPLLANQALDAVRDETVRAWQLPTSQLPSVYENTAEGAGLRRFFIFLISHIGGSGNLEEDFRLNWPGEALWDLAKCLWKLKEDKASIMSKADLANLSTCAYHTHETGVDCLKK
ncbi:hypothetical protein LTR97_008001 [Elasticomyces elasticus]|uniref:BTB domain-containing protein n=1 Tax=Elasticomyces elasticus TaxID=574655 RepID=A0AAN7W5U4_9PEZI|nr:hypothetical protein LTR97_008001 [Elasticomyces elasticus]